MPVGVMWRVRLDDGSEYGPVDEGKLLSWAREGRITPSSQISSDGMTWIRAPRKPELGMDWLVETSPGEYFGPFHHDVVQGLLDSKKITSETRTFRLSDKSEPALKSEIGKLKADYERVKSEKENAAKRVQSLSTELDKSRAETAESTRRAEALASELSQNRTDAKAREEALAAAGKRDIALSAEIGQLKTALRKIELELTSSQENMAAERARADRITAELERVSAGKAAETARANELAAELSRLNATLDHEKSQGEQLRSSLAAASKREAALAEKAKDSGTALEQLKSEQAKTKAQLEKAEARGAELESSLKTSEEKCNALAAEVEVEQDRGRKFGELLSASACRETSLAEEARSLKNAMDQVSARVRELSEELELARAEVAKERKTCGELRAVLEKTEKARKKTGFGNLFQGKSLRNLSLLELAAQCELARRKRGRGAPGHDRSNADVIDV